MKLAFSKMHGLGNDFMVIDNLDQSITLNPVNIRQWSDRHWGVGFDQLLVIEPPSAKTSQFSYRIFNADGNEVEHCGNGARCFARYVHNHGLSERETIVVDTIKGPLELTIDDTGYVSVMMGTPTFEAEQIPLDLAQAEEYTLENDAGDSVRFAALAIGNPHAVIQVDNVHDASVDSIGPWLESHQAFPNQVNVGFMEIIDRANFNLRVFERGVGETKACGSGACAAAVAAIRAGHLDDEVTAHLTGGNLAIRWAGEGAPVYMRGPAVEVFRGQLELDS